MAKDSSEKLNSLLSDLGLLNHRDEKLWTETLNSSDKNAGEEILIGNLNLFPPKDGEFAEEELAFESESAVIDSGGKEESEPAVMPSGQWEQELKSERELEREGLKLDISEDGMEAFLCIHSVARTIISHDFMKRYLARNKIKFGIEWSEINAAVDRVRKGLEVMDLQIAKGLPVQEGRDGEVFFYFEKSRVLKKSGSDVAVEHGEKIDFRKSGFLNMVNKGQLLAEKFFPEYGIDGRDVTGKSVSCHIVKDPPLIAGKNVYLTDDGRLFSKVDGMPIYEGSGRVSVEPVFAVAGDVNLTIGNIKFNGNVLVSGSVLTGFTVEAGGDVHVRGSVEGASIIAGGTITIERGFVGGEKGLLRSGGDCNISHANGGTIECGGSLFVQKELINVKVFVANDLVFLFRKGSLIGGNIAVRGDIDVYNIGSTLGTTTNVYMGNRKFLRKHLEKISVYLDALNKKLKLLETVIKALEKGETEDNEHLVSRYKSLEELMSLLGMSGSMAVSEQQREKLKQLLYEKRHFLTRERDDFRVRALKIKSDLGKYVPHFVRVHGSIFPGVNIVINDAEDYKNCDMLSAAEFYEDPQTHKVCHRPCTKQYKK